MNKTKKIWQVNAELNKIIESFTVGEDYILDKKLLPYDIKASLAHIKMLYKGNILSEKEFSDLQKGLNEILKLWRNGGFQITQDQEDGHTAIEQFLTEKYSEAGAKIHTGRSRNDQVLIMMRLFMLDEIKEISVLFDKLETALRNQSKKNSELKLPGYTHAQKAMVASISMWLESFADGILDQKPFLKAMNKLLDQSPLGSAAGFGIRNFKNNRKLTAKIMGLSKVQENPMYCGLSRGHFENQFLQSISPTMLLLSRLNSDLLLFTMSEFNFMKLPVNMTTGSSIMPQKRNYDVLEIVRGRINAFLSSQLEIQNLIRNLISGYNRDLQLTKKSFVIAVENAKEILEIMILVIKNLEFNKDKLNNAMTADLFITEKVYELVNKGVPFRDAYQKIKKEFLK